ncbi:type VII secretion target [Nocardia sp. AB354]|uniref:type VII secretion target n=1 Tax=Nocardia sp. AB354 TaxID=3413283 RepID=UPI003C153E73
MSDYLYIEPDQLREMARQHEQWAESLHKWGEIPEGWLKRFQSEYGTIADPVRHELNTYYQNRHEKAEFLVRKHLRTRDELLATAAALEEAEHQGGGDINRVGGGGAPAGTEPAQPGPTGPTGPGRDVPGRPGIPPESESPVRPGRPPATVSDIPARDTNERSGPVDPVPAAAAAQTSGAVPPAAMSGAPAGAVMPGVSLPVGDVVPPTGEVDLRGSRVDAPGTVAWDSTPTDSQGPLGTVPGISSGPPVGATGAVGGMDAIQRGTSPTLPNGLAAAISDAKRRQTLPAAGEPAVEDLVLARTLLAGVLAAVAGSAPGLEWAVALSRNPRRPGRLVIALTSNEGRGWLPAGLFLPPEVIIPWRHDSILGTDEQKIIGALEGSADPSRILFEFGSLVSRHADIRFTALASSTAVSDDIRTALGRDVGVADLVTSEESAVDLTTADGVLVDRLTLAGSAESLQLATTVPEWEIRERCLELARAADLRLSATRPVADRETLDRRAWRAQILDALSTGRPVPPMWWDRLRAVDGQETALPWRRTDPSGIPIGSFVDLPPTEPSRTAFFERRADELLLLIASGLPDRQRLRDVLYSYGQIAEHPALATPTATSMAQIGAAAAIAEFGISGPEGSNSRNANFAGLDEVFAPGIDFSSAPAGSEGSNEQRRA